eukprot:scaffold320154_cov99-Cyclotella_meneghiniana.AAC.1
MQDSVDYIIMTFTEAERCVSSTSQSGEGTLPLTDTLLLRQITQRLQQAPRFMACTWRVALRELHREGQYRVRVLHCIMWSNNTDFIVHSIDP